MVTSCQDMCTSGWVFPSHMMFYVLTLCGVAGLYTSYIAHNIAKVLITDYLWHLLASFTMVTSCNMRKMHGIARPKCKLMTLIQFCLWVSKYLLLWGTWILCYSVNGHKLHFCHPSWSVNCCYFLQLVWGVWWYKVVRNVMALFNHSKCFNLLLYAAVLTRELPKS